MKAYKKIMNDMYEMNVQQRLTEIESEIKKAESDKNTGMILMIISIFFLWPLLIVGGIQYSNAKKKIETLNDEKKRIMFQDYLYRSNQNNM